MAEITMENVEEVFRPRKFKRKEGTEEGLEPEDDAILKTIKLLEDAFVEMAKTILSTTPRCADRSAVLRDLRVAKMMCTDAIAKGGLI